MTKDEVKGILNEDQFALFEEMITFTEADNGNMLLVKGVAGSGKTTLISNYIKYYLATYTMRRIACTATTNKAVKVLVEKIKVDSKYENMIVFSTIHKRLGLKETINDFGEQLFLPDFDSIDNDNNYHTIIIDECSMISSVIKGRDSRATSLWQNLVQFANQFNIKLIFVGDFCQIPPVGEERCILDMPSTIIEHNIKVLELTKVVRQAQGSPIIQVSTFVREHQDYKLITYNYQTVKTEFGNVVIANRDNVPGVMELIREHVQSEEFKENSDYFRVLAWTNAKVNSLNGVIRNMIYGSVAARESILVGERLIADKPILHVDGFKKTVLYTTSEEFEVVGVRVAQSEGRMEDGKDTFKVYRTKVLGANDHEPVEIDIIHPDDKHKYALFLDGIKKSAIEQKNKQLWRWFYSIQDRFANIAYQYCLTVHKSQGSTFKNAMVIEADIFKNQKHRERNQILYTAYTRPSETLFIVR